VVRITLNVNGEEHQLDVAIYTTLRDALRDNLGFTDVKSGCGEGECGACTVLVDGRPIASCLMLAAQAQGKKLITARGLVKDGKLHPLQEKFIEHGVIQCGYCTPGMLLTAKALLDKNPHPTEEDIKLAISGNMCRCTGYQQIIEAIMDAASAMSKSKEVLG
jgi:carbon-monoxide dehydrogenase small subunit